MSPRLQLMKSMLKPGGVLAICIDQRELFHLGQMLDERTLRISAKKVLRMRPSDLPTLGLDPAALTSPEFAACQRVAAHAAFLDYEALIVPSARADGSNIVILVNELAAEATFERVGVEQIA